MLAQLIQYNMQVACLVVVPIRAWEPDRARQPDMERRAIRLLRQQQHDHKQQQLHKYRASNSSSPFFFNKALCNLCVKVRWPAQVMYMQGNR